MQTLDVREAAGLLHMNEKRVQSLARQGKLPAVRVGRRWLFQRDVIESLLGCPVAATAPPSLAISARNRLRGEIVDVRMDGLMAEVVLRIGDQHLTSVITRSSAERMRLREGDEVYAVVKATEVMIGKHGVDE